MPEEKTDEPSSITIELDDNSKAFYAGVAAASRAEKQLDEIHPVPDFNTRLAWFWLRVGAAMGRLYTDEQTDLTTLFVQGAATRKPQQRNVVQLSITSKAIEHYGEDADDDEIRRGLRALIETVAQRIQDGVDEGDVWNSNNASVGKFRTNLWG